MAKSTMIVGLLLLAGLALSMAEPVVLTTENFKKMTSDGNAYFIKFYAPWCGHCKRLAPVWDELSDALGDSKVKIAKVDCTVHREICASAEVKGYPTLLAYHNGELLEKYSGGRSLDSLKEFASGLEKKLF